MPTDPSSGLNPHNDGPTTSAIATANARTALANEDRTAVGVVGVKWDMAYRNALGVWAKRRLCRDSGDPVRAY